jgi:UDP-GlcNAc:undecaprenyl-phosphate GlcNAc-1-phosphate transferase
VWAVVNYFMKNNIILYGIILSSSIIVSFTLTKIFRIVSIRLKILDHPNKEHKTHKTSVPYLGGPAIVLSLVLVTTFFQLFVDVPSLDVGIIIFLIAPSLLISFIGLLDDLKGFGFASRLIFQFLLASLTTFIFFNGSNRIELFQNDLIDFTIMVVWIVAITNSINFIDNLDGLSSITLLIIVLNIFIITLISQQSLVPILCINICGTLLGFLYWNKPQAKIYMGDSGSLFLGFLVSLITANIDFKSVVIWNSAALPIMIMSLPLLDLCTVVISRFIGKRSIFVAGRDHLSHRLLNYGYTKYETLGFLILTNIFLSTIALIFFLIPQEFKIYIFLIFLFFWGLFLLFFLKLPQKSSI